MRWLDSITNSMDMNLSKVQEMVKSGDPGVLQSMGSKRVEHDLPAEERQVPLGVPGRAELTPNQF